MEHKLIIAGSRSFSDYQRMVDEANQLVAELPDTWEVSIVSGMARGADALAVKLARNSNVKLYEFPADWQTHGRSAGFKRNMAMAHFADGLLAFWDGISPGTRHMIQYMQGLGKPVKVIQY